MSQSTLTPAHIEDATLEDLEFSPDSAALDESETAGHDAPSFDAAGMILLIVASAVFGFLAWMFTADWDTLNEVTNLMYQPNTASVFESVRIIGAAVFLTSAVLSIPKVSITTSLFLARHWWIPITALLAVVAYPAINFLTCMAQIASASN